MLDKIIHKTSPSLKEYFGQRLGQYILSIDRYQEEVNNVLNKEYDDELLYSSKFALFRANLINFQLSSGQEKDFHSFCSHIRCLELYKVQQRVLFLSHFIQIDSGEEYYKQFKEKLLNKESIVLVSYHYSNYKALVHYLLTLSVELIILSGDKQKRELENEALDLLYVYNTIGECDSTLKFITAEDKTSLIQIHQLLNKQGSRPKVLLIYIDGNIGHSGHQIKNNLYHFRNVEVSMREGLNMLLTLLRVPVFCAYVEDTGLELKICFIGSYIFKDKDITTSLLKALETIVQPKTFIKWECLMYLHHWIANKDSLPLIENVEDRRIKVLSQGEVFYLDTHEYVYTKED